MSTTLTSREIVVYALFLLGGETKNCHTEEIALKCFELAPESFSWSNYPEYPDKDIVRVALTDARKEKYGKLVDGRTGQRSGHFQKTQRRPRSDGWGLTEAGIEWIEENEGRFTQLNGDLRAIKDHRQKSLKFLGRVRRHKTYQLFMDSPEKYEPSIGELADLLRCRVDADTNVWRDRFARLRKHAQSTKQAEIIQFLEKSEFAFDQQR